MITTNCLFAPSREGAVTPETRLKDMHMVILTATATMHSPLSRISGQARVPEPVGTFAIELVSAQAVAGTRNTKTSLKYFGRI